ncbi:MAG: hypothetical protein HC809_12500 [Gammaproteobacteria bacterium]|nr:hypothetical protein [Gammaproteobacteria bacterium]
MTNGGVQWERRTSERASVGLGVVSTWYSSSGPTFTNDVVTVGPALTLRYELSQTLSCVAEASYRQRTSDQVFFDVVELTDTSEDYFGSLRVEREFERGFLQIEASRNLLPGSSGQQEIRDRASVALGYELSARTSMHLSGIVLRDRADQSVRDDERRGFAGDASINRELSERLAFNAAYRYLWQDGSDDDNEARGHSVVIGLTWVIGVGS